MQSDQATLASVHWRKVRKRAPLSGKQPEPIVNELVERAARALFECVFSCCDRLDGKNFWINCNEETREGFRAEAIAVLEAVWPRIESTAVTVRERGM